jgi:hypothetical protein
LQHLLNSYSYISDVNDFYLQNNSLLCHSNTPPPESLKHYFTSINFIGCYDALNPDCYSINLRPYLGDNIKKVIKFQSICKGYLTRQRIKKYNIRYETYKVCNIKGKFGCPGIIENIISYIYLYK